jgi:GNAT superfamily N-acetyltransferase
MAPPAADAQVMRSDPTALSLASRTMKPHLPPVTIRPATAEDGEALTELRTTLFRELGDQSPPDQWRAFEQMSAASFHHGIERGECFAWLAEPAAARPVASTALLVLPRLPTPKSLAQREGYLLSVYTLPAWRGQGIAAALVTAAVTKARELGLARIRLHATMPGRGVYSAAGFRPRNDEMELGLGDSTNAAG